MKALKRLKRLRRLVRSKSEPGEYIDEIITINEKVWQFEFARHI